MAVLLGGGVEKDATGLEPEESADHEEGSDGDNDTEQ